jgi:hypothetical protein
MFEKVEAQDIAVCDTVSRIFGGKTEGSFVVTRVRPGFTDEVRLSYERKSFFTGEIEPVTLNVSLTTIFARF